MFRASVLTILSMFFFAALCGCGDSALQTKSEKAARQAAADANRPLERKTALPDGSFNPLPPTKLKPSDNPTTMILANRWRETYEPLLKEVRPADDQPGFYVYTFIDRTRDGIGIQFTYGWQTLGTAALATLTQARLTQTAPPDHYGLPAIDENSTATLSPATVEQTIKRALADSATSNARYIVIGVYEAVPKSTQCNLTIYLVDRQAAEAGNAIQLYQSAPIDCNDFKALSANQREAGRAIADKLIGMNLAPKRRAPNGSRPPLDAELGKIAAMLDTNDGWAIMDGIAQALALQSLYPDDTKPLQAAAYGLVQLSYQYFYYAWSNTYMMDYKMRSYGLAQLALAIDPKPTLSQLNWIAANKACGVPPDQLLKIIAPEDMTRSNPELAAFRRFAMDDIHGEIRGDLFAAEPDWLLLWQDRQQSNWDGRPHQARSRFNECIDQWKQRDAYVYAFMINYTDYERDGAKQVGFSRYVAASIPATQATIAAEMAAILLLEPEAARAQSCAEAGGLTGAEDAELKRFVEVGDYYGLRGCILQSIARWGVPRNANHPAYQALKWLDEQAAPILKDPRWSVSPAGFAGIDFTNAEKLRFHQRRDHLGPMLVAHHEEKVFGSVNGSGEICSLYLKARPGNAAAQHDYTEYLRNNLEDNDLVPIHRRSVYLTSFQSFPVDYDIYYWLGRASFYMDEKEKALNYIHEYMRMARFSSDRPLKVAEFANRYGFNADAVKYYAEALALTPKRYDLANDRAWLLCQMGKAKDPEIRKTFAAPVVPLAGNSRFQNDNIDYLLNWAEDTTAALEAANFFRSNHPDSTTALDWQVSIEKRKGNIAESVRLLDDYPPPDPIKTTPLGIAGHWAYMARAYIALDQIDKAEPCLKKAMAIDDWKGDVIQAMGEYAWAKGDYAEARKQFERSAERYGLSMFMRLQIANCYEKQGMIDKAIDLLEEPIFSMRTNSTALENAARLIYFYAQKGDREKAQKVMNMVLAWPQRTRGRISLALDGYRKLYPKEADEIWSRIDEIMAGPPLFPVMAEKE